MLTISIELYPDHVQQNDQWISKARTVYQIKEMIRALEKQEAALLEELKLLSMFNSSKGGGFLFTRIERPGSIQYDLIPELQNVDRDRYRKPNTESWKLELTSHKAS